MKKQDFFVAVAVALICVFAAVFVYAKYSRCKELGGTLRAYAGCVKDGLIIE